MTAITSLRKHPAVFKQKFFAINGRRYLSHVGFESVFSI